MTSETRQTTSGNRRKAAALALAFIGVAGLAIGAAAQLNFGTGSLGAGTTVVASCQGDTPIGVSFDTAFVPGADAGYKASSLELTSIESACEGLTYKVTLTDADGEVLGDEVTGTVEGSSVAVPLEDVAADDVSHVSVVMYS